MRIDSTKYGGRCACGKEHKMATRLCVIESGALGQLEELLEQQGLGGKTRCAVYGSVTWQNPAFSHPRAAQEIVRDQYGDCGFGSLNDVIEEVRPVFLKERFFSDHYYRLSWQISVRSRERKSMRVFFVDATTGRVWDDHDGAIDTVYTQYLG